MPGSDRQPERLTASDLYLSVKCEAWTQDRIGFRPRPDLPPWPLALPVDWGADPFTDRNWRFQLNAWRMTDPLLRDYFHSGAVGRLREAFAFVEDWYRHHLLERRANTYAWFDMAVGIRALRLAFFIEVARRRELSLDGERMQRLLELADAHVERLTREEEVSRGNHGIFQMAGLNLLCMAAPERDGYAAARVFAARKFAQIMAAQFTEEGVHTENSPSYHFFVGKLLRELTALRHFGDGARHRMRDIEAVGEWLAFPNGEVAHIGDSSGQRAPLAEDPDRLFPLGDRRFAVGDFTRSGYAIVRSPPSQPQRSMLFVTGMAHTRTHKHADELSFELFEFGRFIFVDSGKYGYESRRPLRGYVLSAAAHNTVSLLDRPIGPRDVALSGSLLAPIRHEADGFRIEGALERAGLFSQRRSIVYDPGRSLTITDRLEAGRELSFVSSLHLAPDLEPVLQGNGFTVEVEGHAVRAELLSPACTLCTVRGQAEPLLGWYSTGYLEAVPTTVVRALRKARSSTIAWRIRFS